MKHLISKLTAAILAVCVAVVVVSAATAYISSVTGFETSRGTSGDILISTRVAGDLPGTFTIRVSQANGVISGGEWSRDVIGTGQDGAAIEIGNLKGTVSGGGLTLNDSSHLVTLNAQLTVTSGTNAYSSVGEGGGTFSVSTNQQPHSEVNGTLNMNF